MTLFAPFPAQLISSLSFCTVLKKYTRKKTLKKSPKTHPFYHLRRQGPCGPLGSDIPTLARLYGKTGIKDVTYKLYKDARHELVNELNRTK